MTFRPVTLKPRVEETAGAAAAKKQRKQRTAATGETSTAGELQASGAAGTAEVDQAGREESEVVAGPSESRGSMSPERADLLTVGSHLVPPRKPLKKVHIETMEQLLAINLEAVAAQSRCKFSLTLLASLPPVVGSLDVLLATLVEVQSNGSGPEC